MRRVAGLAVLVLALGLALVFVPITVYALISPYTSVVVPAACDGGHAVATAANRVEAPSLGEGTLVAADGPTQLVATAGPDGRTAGGTAVVMVNGSVVAGVPIASRVVAGGIGDGVVYLFDDKIGVTLDAKTGLRLPRLFLSDNYRGLIVTGGVESVQTSIEVTAVGLGGRPFMTMTLPFGAVVDGCLLATP